MVDANGLMMQAGDDPTGWTQTSARLRASLLPDQLLAEGDGEGSDAGTGQDAQQAADSQQESSAESAAGAAHKGASSERADEKERELQEPEVAENGFLARLSGLSGQSSGHSSGSDSRSLTGQPSGHSSMHSIPEGMPESCIDHCLLYWQLKHSICSVCTGVPGLESSWLLQKLRHAAQAICKSLSGSL